MQCYEPEKAPPLLIGGYKKALKYKTDISNVINNKKSDNYGH